MNGRDIIESYKKALGSSVNTLHIDNSISESRQMELLSASLNATLKINEKIPIDILKIDNLTINSDLTNAGDYLNSIGSANIRDNESSQHVASAITKEYAKYIYDTIIMEGSDDMISDLWDLCEELGDVFLNKDSEKILTGHNSKLFNGKSILEHITEPTELFSKAFAAYTLESSERKYQNNLSKDNLNFSPAEMNKFKSKMDSLCLKLKKHLIEKESEKNPNRQANLNDEANLLKNLSKEQRVFLFKNEERLFLKSSGKRSVCILNEDFEQANLANADMEVNATAFRKLYKTFEPEEIDDFRYDHNINSITSTSSDFSRKKYLNMRPDKVYKLSKNIAAEIENLEKQAMAFGDAYEKGSAQIGEINANGYTIDEKLLMSSKENLKYINQTIRLKRSELKDIELSGATQTRDYLKYADVKSREEKAVSFIKNNLYQKDNKGFLNKVLNMDIVKSSVMKLCNSKLCNLQKEAAHLESDFEVNYGNNLNYEESYSSNIKLSSYLEAQSSIYTNESALNNPNSLFRTSNSTIDLENHRRQLSQSLDAKEFFEARVESFGRAANNSISQKIKKKIIEIQKQKDLNNSRSYSSPKEQINAIISRIERNKDNKKEKSKSINGLSSEANNRINELLRQAEAKESYSNHKSVDCEYENDDLSI